MRTLARAVPVLQAANVESTLRWYGEVFGFTATTFPETPPYTFAILQRDDAELMLQCAEAPTARAEDPEFLWSFYLRVADGTILDVAAAAEKITPLRRGPEQMFYGLVEVELCDPDGHRVCVGGEPPPGANVRQRVE